MQADPIATTLDVIAESDRDSQGGRSRSFTEELRAMSTRTRRRDKAERSNKQVLRKHRTLSKRNVKLASLTPTCFSVNTPEFASASVPEYPQSELREPQESVKWFEAYRDHCTVIHNPTSESASAHGLGASYQRLSATPSCISSTLQARVIPHTALSLAGNERSAIRLQVTALRLVFRSHKQCTGHVRCC